MGTAKIVSLQARPSQQSILCFEVDGILGDMKAKLGDDVVAFDFHDFYSTLNGAPTVSTDESLLEYDAKAIGGAVGPSSLASLRSELRKITLNNAIRSRQNAFYAKYANITDIVQKVHDWYSPNVADSKPKRLAELSKLAEHQANALKTAYTNDSRLGVIKQTKSVVKAKTESRSTASAAGGGTQQGKSSQISLTGTVDIPHDLPPISSDGELEGWGFTGSGEVNAMGLEGAEAGSSTNFENTSSLGMATEDETILNTDYGYRMPYLESQAQNQRAQISLIDQRFAQYMYAQPLPHLAKMYRNELKAIDSDVIRLQIAFMNCILLSPFAGKVTGVYKNRGDMVRAGEPVVRVEDNTTVYLVATLVYRDRIAIGAHVAVQTALFDAIGNPATIAGKVVAARGHAPDDDQWDIVVRCKNDDGTGNEIVPLNYSFDFDDTVVTIS